MNSPQIAIIGAGAVGGYYGARLAQHGKDVHFLLRSDYEAIKQNGWKIKSVAGDFALAPGTTHIYDDLRKMPKADLVIVAIKTTANDQFETLISPLLKENTAILNLQNGVGNDERLAEIFGPERILGGMAFICVNRVAPGVLYHTDHALIRLGEFDRGLTPRARELAQMFTSSNVPCEAIEDLSWGRWAKLIWNVPFNGLGAVLDMTTDQLITSESGVQIVTALMNEVIATAEALGMKMPPDMIDRQMRHTATMGAFHTSMQVDRQEKRPLEIEAILGEPLRCARRAGVSAPKLDMLYHLARLVDPGWHTSVHQV